MNLAVLATIKRHPLGLVVLVGSGGVKIEFGWFLRVFGTEDDFLVGVDVLALLVFAEPTTTHVECFAITKRILLSVNDYDTITTSVDDSKLAVAHEVLGTKFREGFQLQIFGDWHGTAENEAVVHRIREVDFIGSHHLLHHEAVANGLCVVVLHIFRMASLLKVHMHLSRHAQCAHQEGKT